jgi:hypothetical protein
MNIHLFQSLSGNQGIDGAITRLGKIDQRHQIETSHKRFRSTETAVHFSSPTSGPCHPQSVTLEQLARQIQMSDVYYYGQDPRRSTIGIINLDLYFGFVSDEEMIEYSSQNEHLDI